MPNKKEKDNDNDNSEQVLIKGSGKKLTANITKAIIAVIGVILFLILVVFGYNKKTCKSKKGNKDIKKSKDKDITDQCPIKEPDAKDDWDIEKTIEKLESRQSKNFRKLISKGNDALADL